MSDLSRPAKDGKEIAKVTDLAGPIKPGSANEPRVYPPGQEKAILDGNADV